jgi:hypothetical protein
VPSSPCPFEVYPGPDGQPIDFNRVYAEYIASGLLTLNCHPVRRLRIARIECAGSATVLASILFQQTLARAGNRTTDGSIKRKRHEMYYFFFSYSRNDNNRYLKTFYTDLDEAVRDMVGREKVSFFDQSGNEPGDHWENNLKIALSTSRVLHRYGHSQLLQ